ncbi:hypothetical protein ACVWZR_002631 [Bradyrhizobium sp. i1.3.1]
MHGKFALAPISEAQAQTATSMPKGTDKTLVAIEMG